VLAAAGVLSAAAPTMVAPFRKFRRPESGAPLRREVLRFDMLFSRGTLTDAYGPI
jgi:hypothetical protein